MIMSAIVAAPREFLEAVAALHMPIAVNKRLHVLMDRNNDGDLTDEERNELKAVADLSEQMSLVRAEASRLLTPSSAT
jgi:hypothetical protein